jgi:hypothetical protein
MPQELAIDRNASRNRKTNIFCLPADQVLCIGLSQQKFTCGVLRLLFDVEEAW